MANAVNNLLGLGLAPRVAPGAPRAHPAPAPSPRCSFKPTQRCSPRRAAVVVASAAPGSSAAALQPSAPHVQLATARLPADVDVATFNRHLYQWAATLTTNGRNLPFSLPLKADPRDDGFQISLLRVAEGGDVVSVADIVASVEASEAGAGNVLFVRFYEGNGAAAVGLGGGKDRPTEQRLQTLLDGLVDVPLIMQTMPEAIKKAVVYAR
ncbi:hypothetical protein COHA_006402 [Chlorella ohadii]|uniref:DUF7148 domain-containing protein n=1 Tax=Chlorella ohadii TaxID=2649997 RepID=A0AAD5DSY3_9CHLO|nr:hypothetical protein COHA_006402 [Chlorella ohadii]